MSLAARGSRLFKAIRSFGSPARTAGRVLHALGHEHGLARGGGRGGAVAAGEPCPVGTRLKIALQFTARLLPLTDVLTQGAGAREHPRRADAGRCNQSERARGRNWIRHRLTAANHDAAGNAIAWSRRIIYGDRFVRPRYAEVTCSAGDDDIVRAYRRDCRKHRLGDQAGNVIGHDDNIVWGNGDNIVWGNDDNIVWGNAADDNIVWGNDESDNMVCGIDDNIVWGQRRHRRGATPPTTTSSGATASCAMSGRRTWCGFWDDNIDWGNITRDTMDNIVWGNSRCGCEWGVRSCECGDVRKWRVRSWECAPYMTQSL